MNKLLLLISVCSQNNVYWATEYIPCGLTSCYNVGYEVCIGPPEVRTEADSDCYSCDALAQIENPCDPAAKRIGCMKYCTDEAIKEQRKAWNKSLEILTHTNHDLTKQQTEAVQHQQSLRERSNVYLIGLPCLAALIFLASVVFCMRRQYRRKRKRIYAEPEESCAISLVLAHSSSNTQLTVTTDMTKLINETEKHHSPEQLNKETDIGRAPPVTPPSDNNDADSIKEARSEPRGNSTTDIVDQPGASGSPEPHDGQCHDGRLCSVSPQSKDHGKLCTNSSYFKYPTETNG